MKRTVKYPDTDVFNYYNANPKDYITSDCVYRALALALGKAWREVVMELAETALTTGRSPASVENMDAYLKKHGFVKKPQPKHQSGKKYTGAEFCREHKETVIMNIGGHHVTCSANGQIHDIWDCTNKCVGNYWVAE
jgi:hypothetical protein